MFKKSILFCALSIASSSVFSQDLFTVYKEGLQYNAAILSAEKSLDAQRENINLSGAALRPQFGVEASVYRADVDITTSDYQTDYSGVNYAFKFQQPLYNAESYRKKELSKESAEVSEAEYNEVRYKKSFEVIQAYFNYLRYQNNVIISKQKQRAMKSQLDRVKKEYSLGAANRLNLNEAESAYDVAAVETLTQRGRLEIAQENLAQLTGEYYTNLTSIDYRAKMFPVKKEFSDWRIESLKNNPTIKRVRKLTDVSSQRVEVAKAEYMPEVNFFTSYEHLDRNDDRNLQGGNRNDFVFGIEFNYPIYTGGSTTSKVKKAIHEYRSVGYDFADVTRNVSAEVKKVFRNFQLTSESIAARGKALKSASDALEATKKGYSLGQRNFQDIINAERTYYDAMLSYVNSKYDYITQYFYLEFLSGNLNESTVLSVSRWMEKVSDKEGEDEN